MKREEEYQKLESRSKTIERNLHNLHEKRDVLEEQINNISKEEKKEYEQLEYSFKELDQMREKCQGNDYELLQLIDDKQRLLRGLWQRKEEFDKECRIEFQKQSEKIEIESNKQQILNLEHDNSNKEGETGGVDNG